MIVKETLTDELPALQIGDSYSKVIEVFRETGAEHLPVMESGTYKGILGLDSIEHLEHKELTEKSNLLIKEYITESDEMYKCWELISKYKLTALPFFDQTGKYVKTIKARAFVKKYNISHHLSEQGCTLILEIKRLNFSLGLVSGIIEEHFLYIEHYSIIRQTDEGHMEVLIKLNDECNEQLISDLERHNFEIKLVFSTSRGTEIFKDRYDELMHYLNV